MLVVVARVCENECVRARFCDVLNVCVFVVVVRVCGSECLAVCFSMF